MAGSGAPKNKVKSQSAPKRGERSSKVSVSWGSAKGDGAHPVEGYDAYFFLNGEKKKDKKGHKYKGSSSGSAEYSITRSNWYPYKGKPKLLSVITKVRPYNKSGNTKRYGPYHSATKLEFKRPDKPSIANSVDVERGEITFAVASVDPGGSKERHDAFITVRRRGKGGEQKLFDKAVETESWSKVFDIEDSKSLTQTQWIEVTCNAYARGFRGNSDAATESKHIFAWPRSGVIGTIGIQSINSENKTGMIVVPVSLAKIADASGKDQSGMHPVDTVQLQRLRSSSAKTAAQAAIAEDWQDVAGALDDGNCQGLTDQLSDAYPDPGTRTWYRLKTVHDDYTVYGDPKDLGVYDNPEELVLSNVEIFDTSASNGDGESVIVRYGWDSDDATGVEISWSEYEDAWRSSNLPTTQEVTYDDGPVTVGDKSYDHSSWFVIRNLTENTPYFIKARTYVTDADDKTLFGAYCTPKNLTPTSSPRSVTLIAPMFVSRGDDLVLSWTFDSNGTQTQYIVYDNTEPSSRTWSSGSNSLGSCVIPASQLVDIDELFLAVAMTTGGDWVDSTRQYVEEDGETVLKENVFQHIVIADPPTCSVAMPSVIETQPVQVDITSNSNDASVMLSLISVGGIYDYPDRTVRQAEGDVVWSDAIGGIDWELRSLPGDELLYGTSVTLPDGLTLFDGCDYTLTATVTDTTSGLSSQESTVSTTVVWEHQAVEPSATIEVNPDEYTVTITTEAPAEGYAIGDICDVYRMTPDGAYRITPEDGVAFGTVVTDRLAPYVYEESEQPQTYRVALRTIDGDVEFADIPYVLYGWSLRFDWDDEFVELPFNITIDDNFNNGFEARTHLDGITEGYWAEGVEHSSSMNTDLIRFHDEEQKQLVMRGMIRHFGAIFMRQPNGCAYAANVIPKRIYESYDSQVLGVSIDAREIALTDEYRPDEGDIERPEWSGGALTIFRDGVYDAAGLFPLFEWEWLGRSEELVDYVLDGDDVIRMVSGVELTGYTWNGTALVSEDGTVEIPLSKEL